MRGPTEIDDLHHTRTLSACVITDRVVCESCAAAKYLVAHPSKSNRSKRRCSCPCTRWALVPSALIRTGQSASALNRTYRTVSRALFLPISLLRCQDHFSCSQMCGARGKTSDEDGGCGTTARAFAEGEQPRMYHRVASLFMYEHVANLLDVASLNSLVHSR